jgi:outer membrane protein
MSGRLSHMAAVFSMVASLVVSPVYAQEAQVQAQPALSADQARNLKLMSGPDYSKGNPWWPPFVSPYKPVKIPEPLLTNSPGIDQLVQNGKLMLSLDDAISLALENNLDIAVQRLTPSLDQVALLRAESGVNGRLLLDPTLTGQLTIEKSSTPINNPFLAGVGSTTSSGAVPVPAGLISHNGTANFTYTEGFRTGTQLQVSLTNTRSSINLGSYLLNPFVQSALTAVLTQPLLNGFGKLPNTRFILEAKNTVKVGDLQFAQQVITTVTQVANDFWELVYARENVKVEEAAVGVSQKLYEDNKKQLEIGTMAPLDVLTAESQLATDQQNLIVARSTQLLDETTLLLAITKDPLAGPLAGIEIVPTTSIPAPDTIENIPLQEAVKEAWQKRPELQQAELNLKNAGIEVKYTKNELLPALNLFGLFTSTGVGGVSHSATSTPTGSFAETGDLVFPAGSAGPGGIVPAGVLPFGFSATPVETTVRLAHQSGIVDDYDRLFRAKYPTYEAGINFTLPIRNRAAEADNAQATLVQRQQQVQYRQTENTIVLNVRNALIALQQDRAQVAAAQKAQDLAAQTLDDEQKKYQLGSSTSYNVVLRSRDLTAAEGTLLRARINLVEAEVNFNQAMGRTLDVNRITVADAKRGKLSGAPNIPGAPDAGTSQGR